MAKAALELIHPIVRDVLSALPSEARADPAAVRQAWLDNMGRSVGGEAALGRVAAGKLSGALALRMARSSSRMLALSPRTSAAGEPSDIALAGAACLPVEAVLRLRAQPATPVEAVLRLRAQPATPGTKAGLQALHTSSQLKPKPSPA